MTIFQKTIFLIFTFLVYTAFAIAGEVGFVNSNIWVSNQTPLEGENLKLYSIVVNSDKRALEAEIIFYYNEQPIDSPISFTLNGDGKTDVFSKSWTAIHGNHEFKAVIQNAFFVDQGGNKTPAGLSVSGQTTHSVFVDIDSDGDEVGDQTEIDQGTNPNNPDTDEDGESDNDDPSPLNPKIFAGPDTDGDGIPDTIDTDCDNDGSYNWEEEEIGTKVCIYDTDKDGYSDKEDAYPLDPNKRERKETTTGIITDNSLNNTSLQQTTEEIDDNAINNDAQEAESTAVSSNSINTDNNEKILGAKAYLFQDKLNNIFSQGPGVVVILSGLAIISLIMAYLFFRLDHKKRT